MDNRLVKFTKYLLDVMFYVGIGLTIMIPGLFRIFGRFIVAFRKYYFLQCGIYMISGVFCLMIVYELRKMFITVLAEDAFVDQNAKSLKKMGKCSFFISALSLVRLPLSPTPATVVIMIVFAIAGLFSIVLCQVFEKAIQYKLENDLTI
ncbi:MAG: DUF2975 domain-containing protein [Clostridiaceae bacterium]|nr:DUF2975 domain-containing protein [Clostridiaceae bacterium]